MRAYGFGVRLGVTASILCALLPAAAAGEPAHPICPLIVHQERVDGEERELEVELAESRRAAAQSIFDLVDQLWQSETVERIVYLAAKHERDVAELEVTRQRLLLERQEAVVEQFEIVCLPPGSGESAAQRSDRLGDASRRYLQADCHRIGKDLAIAEADLIFRHEVLKSLRDLRENDVGTLQDVIRAERDVETARERVDRHRRRVGACEGSGAASGAGV